LQTMILQWIYSNKGITIQDLANNINKPNEEIQEQIDLMIEAGLLTYGSSGFDILSKGVDALDKSGVQTEIVTMWKYDKAPGISGGKIIGTSRDFCKRIVALNRVYSRQDIDQISSIVGYDVWKRRGGWMTVKNSKPAVHVPYCRHIWQPQLLRRKING
jgi:hypothetical protein